MSRPEYQQRVIEEKHALDVRLYALVGFIGCTTYRKLSDMEKRNLTLQREAMTLYSRVLGARIAAFDTTLSANAGPVVSEIEKFIDKAPVPGLSWFEHA